MSPSPIRMFFRMPFPRQGRDASMRFIMFAVLIDMMSIGIIVPVLPILVGSFTGSQSDQAFWYGMLTFSFSIANFIAAPILGPEEDVLGVISVTGPYARLTHRRCKSIASTLLKETRILTQQLNKA